MAESARVRQCSASPVAPLIGVGTLARAPAEIAVTLGGASTLFIAELDKTVNRSLTERVCLGLTERVRHRLT